MRIVNDEEQNHSSIKGMARIARNYADYGIDSYSDFGVGVSLLINFQNAVNPEGSDEPIGVLEFPDKEEVRENRWSVYAGFNINMSGMEYKVHAEQMAMFQALLDIHRWELQEFADVVCLVVATTEDDFSLTCGHCLQVTRSFCDHLNTDPSEVRYIAAAKTPDEEEEFAFEKHDLPDLLGNTYAEK